MSRTPARFTQADIARALRAIEQTGQNMTLVIGQDGEIRIFRYSLSNSTKPPVDEDREIVL